MRGIWRKTLPALAFTLLAVIPVYHTPLDQEPKDACVLAIQKDMLNFNLDAVMLSVTTGKAFLSPRPIIPPDGLFSPDGKHVAFWYRISAERMGLYIASVAAKDAVLVYETPVQEGWHLIEPQRLPRWLWAPDSSSLAFIGVKDEQYSINVVDSSGRNRRSLVLKGDTVLYGWTTDSVYIAAGTYHGTVSVWRAKDLSLVTAFSAWPGTLDAFTPAAWSPKGHKLALLLDNGKAIDGIAAVVIWSPEKGVEAKSLVELVNEYYELYWSPNGKMLWVHDYWGHGDGANNIYFVDDSKIMGKDAKQIRQFLGWSGEEWATILDWGDWDKTELTRINARTGARQVIDSESLSETITSPDGTWIAYLSGQENPDTRVTYRAKVVDIYGNNKRTFFETTIEPGAFVSSPGEARLLWSPNSQYVSLYWYREEDDRPGEYSTDLIVATATGSTIRKFSGDNLTWMQEPRASYVLYSDNEYRLELINMETGEILKLVSSPGKTEEHNLVESRTFARISPDGRTAVGVLNGQALGLVSFDTQSARQIPLQELDTSYAYASSQQRYLRNFDWTGYLLSWSPDSSMLAFVETTEDSFYLIVVDRHGQEVRRVNVRNLQLDLSTGFQGPIVWTTCN